MDYFFLYGPELERAITSYRDLTGAAPMFGRWLVDFGSARTGTRAGRVAAGASKYRDLHIPIDNIVQDCFWWTQLGDHTFIIQIQPAWSRNFIANTFT